MELKFKVLALLRVKQPINDILQKVKGVWSNLYGKPWKNIKGMYNSQANIQQPK